MLEVRVPKMGVNDEYARIAQWHVENNTQVKKGAVICTLETSKATLDVESERDGFAEYRFIEGQTIKVGDILLVIKDSASEKAVFGSNKDNALAEVGVRATKKAMELARQYKVDIEKIGKKGVIKEDDVRGYISASKKMPCSGDKASIPFSSSKAGKIDKSFLIKIAKDEEFKKLPGTEKLSLYRNNGAKIASDVKLGKDSLILAEYIVIGDGVSIGANTFIKTEYLSIGKMAVIGNESNIVTRYVEIGDLLFSGNRILIGGGGAFGEKSGIKTGIGCLISSECIINTSHEVILGDYVGLSPRVQIYTHNHWQNILQGHKASFGPVIIGDNSYITGNVLIAPNVMIGRNVTVLANSLVAENLDDRIIAAGVPAKIVGNTNPDLSNEQKDRIMKAVTEDIKSILRYKEFDPEKTIYSFECDLEKIDAGVVLGFEFKGKKKESQIIFDMTKYEIFGKQDRYSDEVRNILRKRGMRFSPIYWRYSADEGFYNQ